MSEVEQSNLAERQSAPDQSAVESYLYALNNNEAFELRRWWQRLTMDKAELARYTKQWPFPRGVRAVLHRSESVPSVMTTEAFRHLWFALESRVWVEEQVNDRRRDQRLDAWATIAAVAAELREETFDIPLARRLGENRPNTHDMPRMSDLRFQQLLDCHEPVELIRRFRRALKLAGNTGISVVRLADMVALWHREHHGQYRPKAAQRFAFVMSNDYFNKRVAQGAPTE